MLTGCPSDRIGHGGLVGVTHSISKWQRPSRSHAIAIATVYLFLFLPSLLGLAAMQTKLWTETHRWNFGLQEDLDEAGGMVWNHPHLPWCSAEGLVDFKKNLSWDSVH